MSSLLRASSRTHISHIKKALIGTQTRFITTSGPSARTAAPIETIDKFKFRFAVGGKWTEGIDKQKVQILREPTKTEKRTYPREEKTVQELPTWTREELSTLAHEVANSIDAETYSNVRLDKPYTRAPGRFGTNKLTTNPQKERAKVMFNYSVQQLRNLRMFWNRITSVPEFAGIQSSPSAPLEFGENNQLKYVVIDAIMSKAQLNIPSSYLGKIKNVNDVVDTLISIRDARSAKVATKTDESKYPPNVGFSVKSTPAVLQSLAKRNQFKKELRLKRDARTGRK